MAGDTKPIDAEALPPPAVDDPFPSIQQTLDAMLADQRSVEWETLRVAFDAVAVSQFPRLRVRYLIISSDIADEVTLTIGTARYPFHVGIGTTPPIPIPLVIERGADIAAISTGAAVGSVYLIGNVE
jgi:hypothetical protein